MARIRQALNDLIQAIEQLESRNDDLKAENLSLRAQLQAARAGLSYESPHEVLGVDQGANEQQIRAAYRERVKTLHPDTGAADAEAFHRATAARDQLLRAF